MRIRHLVFAGLIGPFALSAQSLHAQSMVRDLEVSAPDQMQIVLVPNLEVAQLKRVKDDKYAKSSYSFFINDYVMRVRQFPNEELIPDGSSRFNATLRHNATLTYILYYSCRDVFSSRQRRSIYGVSDFPVGSVRSFSIENPCG